MLGIWRSVAADDGAVLLDLYHGGRPVTAEIGRDFVVAAPYQGVSRDQVGAAYSEDSGKVANTFVDPDPIQLDGKVRVYFGRQQADASGSTTLALYGAEADLADLCTSFEDAFLPSSAVAEGPLAPARRRHPGVSWDPTPGVLLPDPLPSVDPLPIAMVVDSLPSAQVGPSVGSDAWLPEYYRTFLRIG